MRSETVPSKETDACGPPEGPEGIGFHRTDAGNADRFVCDHGQNVRFVHTWGKWLIWTGKHWKLDETAGILRLARRTAAGIYTEAGTLEDPVRRQKLGKHAAASEGMNRLKAMVELAAAHARVAVTHEALDLNRWLLSVENGTLDLRTGELRPHRQDDLITKHLDMPYDPKAACPTWESFLGTIFDGDDDLINYIQCSVGYTLTGSIREQVLFFLHGTGSNGKSTFLETLRGILGDYAKQAPFDTFLVKREGGIPNDIARLCGARLVTACEADSGKRLSESLVKSLTGGDRITARFMRGEFFEFDPTFKIWLASNHKPAIWGVDHAIWRRIKLVPFTVAIADEDQDKGLLGKLWDELPGILRWAAEGCRQWRERGLDEAAAVALATHEYRQDEDVLSDFIEERCFLEPQVRVRVADLYKAYCAWAEENGGPDLSKKRLGSYLKERPESLRNGKDRTGNRVWWGIGLRAVGMSRAV